MATSNVTSANIKARSETRRAMPARVDTQHRELSSRCWPALVSSAVLSADVGHVMELVAGHGVGDGAHAADGPVRWRAVLPGRRVQAIWREVSLDAGLDVAIDHPDMPPLSSLRFNYPNARAMQTLHCQMMLDRGFLDNCGFYATCAHTDDILDSYANVVRDVFPALGDAQRQNRVEKLLRGPVGHSGFARLT